MNITRIDRVRQTAGSEAAVDPQCSPQLQLSRTTVETAYMPLARWLYHFGVRRAGLCNGCGAGGCKPEEEHGAASEKRPEIRYDFASSNVDRESFQFDLWRRYVKSASAPG